MSATANTLDPESFRAIAELAYRESGLTLVEEKSSMICSRLRHRLRALELPDFSAYSALLKSEQGQAERRHLISALTTNVSHFFREMNHYDTLADILKARRDALRAGQEMRIWSAGCSNGQEAVSAAITVLETLPDCAARVKILATDIDPQVVQFARQGRYPERLMNGVSPALRSSFFHRDDEDPTEAHYTTLPAIRNMIRFKELNLLGSWPMSRTFDAIFCRNVVIYFDAQTQAKLWPRLHKILTPDGTLFLGHSERISDPERIGFAVAGPTTYSLLSR